MFLIITGLLAVSTNSAFLGDKERGMGVEVTRGGDINLLPKTTVGSVNLGNSGTLSSIYALVDSMQAFLADGLLIDGTILISGVAAEKFKTTTTAYYTIDGVQYSDAAADNLTFTAAYTINTGAAAGIFYGIFLVQVNGAGTVSTLAPGADQVYTTSALALAALPDAAADNVQLGYIIVGATTDVDWVANTDDMTDASDCTTATFTDISVKTLPGARP